MRVLQRIAISSSSNVTSEVAVGDESCAPPKLVAVAATTLANNGVDDDAGSDKDVVDFVGNEASKSAFGSTIVTVVMFHVVL